MGAACRNRGASFDRETMKDVSTMKNVSTKATAFAATVVNDPPPEVARGSASLISLSTRTTVLPRLVRVDAPEPVTAEQRFVPLRLLGRGGLGEVTLVR